MTNRKSVSDTVSAAGLIAIVRSKSDAFCFEAVTALGVAGCNVVEATLTTPGALNLVTDVRERQPNITMGIGSVLCVDHVLAAVDAGAQFVVTPVLNTAVIKACNDADLPIVCGAYTPTEAQTAHDAGADFVKLFPADTLGAKYIKALLAPLPHLRIIPTGGVDVTTIPELFSAGCIAVAAGSNLVSEALLVNRDSDGISARARLFVDAVSRARGA
ncbi:MAG: bifunctional 4-hydroxy-2-oxoglutarate aldolase/2-dehydro-3-deoxy-phosphogluconate aldolase [Armatimonadota bacterium]|jgi:2-dehydro-3-deoxyphosphogluconate aldolase/(4S)-4-hydroxy-2-oxoglutarate aldolase